VVVTGVFVLLVDVQAARRTTAAVMAFLEVLIIAFLDPGGNKKGAEPDPGSHASV
jgi:hypothetical protein